MARLPRKTKNKSRNRSLRTYSRGSIRSYGYYQNSSKTSTKSSSAWDSGIEIMKNPKVILPPAAKTLMEDYQEEVGNDEFSILLKGEWTDKGFEVKSLDHVVPEQEVSRASVDYKDNLAEVSDEYNVVLHTHPFTSKGSFSGTDDKYINSHFECSVLFTEQFDDAIINLSPDGTDHKIQIKPEIKLREYRPPHNQDVDTEKITKKSKAWKKKKKERNDEDDKDEETQEDLEAWKDERYKEYKNSYHSTEYRDYIDNYYDEYKTFNDFIRFLRDNFPSKPEDVELEEWKHLIGATEMYEVPDKFYEEEDDSDNN